MNHPSCSTEPEAVVPGVGPLAPEQESEEEGEEEEERELGRP